MQRTLLTRGAKASCQPHPAVPVAAASVQFSFSRGPRQVLVAVALWSVFVAAQRAEAQLTTASNGDWQISYDPQTASLLDWGVVGPDGLLDHLEEHSLHYRLAEGTREFRISELTLNDISTPVPQRIVVDYGDGVQKHFTQLPWKDGLTVLGATQAAQKHPRGIKIKVRSSGSTAFLTQIDDVENEGNGKNWIFRVNGKLADRSSGIYKLDKGDTILWRFQKYE